MKYKKMVENYLNYVKNNCKLRTYIVYENLCKTHLKNAFKNKSVKDIKNKDWIMFFNEKSKTLSNGTLRLILSVIKNIYKHSKCKCDIEVKLSLTNKATKLVSALTKKEQGVIESYILKRKDCYKYGIIISLYTGVRIGELLALTWSDVDFKQNTILITKSVCSICNNNQFITYTDSPKTENGNRVLAIPKCLVPILHQLKNYQNNKSQFVVSKKMVNKLRLGCISNVLQAC